MVESSEGGTCTRGLLYVLTLLAFGLSVVAIADCSFLLIENTNYGLCGNGGGGYSDYYNRDLSVWEPSIINDNKERNLKIVWDEMCSYGFFSYDQDRDEHLCVPYSDNELEAYFNTAGKAGKGFGVTATVLSGIMMMLYTCILLFLEGSGIVIILWRVCIGLICIAIPCQFLTFLAMLTEECKDVDNDCIPGIAGYSSFIAGILFILMGLIMGCCAKPPPKPLVSISTMRKQNKTVRWTELVLSVITFTLSVVVVADCTFIRAGSRSTPYKDMEEYGLFNYNGDDPNGHTCIGYGDGSSFDAAEKTARAFGILAAIVSGYVMIMMTSLNCLFNYKANIVWQSVRIFLIFGVIFQTLTFVAFGSGQCTDTGITKCVVGPAGIIAAFNVCLLFVLACLCWGMGHPEKPLFIIKRRIIEDDEEDEIIEHNTEKGKVPPPNTTPITQKFETIPRGTVIEIRGLVSMPEYNNKLGRILEYLSEEDRYSVELLDTNDIVNLRSNNIYMYRTKPASNDTDYMDEDSEEEIMVD